MFENCSQALMCQVIDKTMYHWLNYIVNLILQILNKRMNGF